MTNLKEKVVEIKNTQFNTEKTEELIAEMQEAGVIVGLEDLSSYIRKQGVIVKVHVGGSSRVYELSPQVYGIDEAKVGEQTKELLSEHIIQSKLEFLPKTYLKKIKSLESNLRMMAIRRSIGYNNTFMTIDIYKEFLEYFEKTKEEFFNTRDEIAENYDKIVARFKEIVKTSLVDLNALDVDGEYKKIVERFGEVGSSKYEKFKNDYIDGFYMTLSVTAFPVSENLDMFEDEVKNQIEDGLREESITALYEMIGNSLNDAFSSIVKLVISGQNTETGIAGRSLSAVKNSVLRLRQKNIFANKTLTTITDNIEKMLEGREDEQSLLQNSEMILAHIYSYAVELNIEDSVTTKGCPLSKDDLLGLASYLEGDYLV